MTTNEWMGRYRPLIKELVKYENYYSRISTSKRLQVDDSIFMSANEWQVLEYIIEHDDDPEYILNISDDLGIAPSSLSKQVKSLVNHGLIERYHTSSNKKKIVVKSTDKGKQLYENNVSSIMMPLFQVLFDGLEKIPDKYLNQFVTALSDYNNSRTNNTPETLIKI